MSYLTEDEITQIGFRRVGKNLQISRKASIYRPETIEIGDNCRIDDFCVISGSIIIGNFVYLAPFCLLNGGEIGIEFDDFSCLSYRVQVFSQSDDYTGGAMVSPIIPSKYKKETRAKVWVNRQVLIGAGSIILPGVDLAEGTAIGAMTLVKESTAPWGIYAGNPCRRLSDRSKDLLDLERQFLRDIEAGVTEWPR